MMNTISGLLAIGVTTGILWASASVKAELASRDDRQASSPVTLENSQAAPPLAIEQPSLTSSSALAQTSVPAAEEPAVPSSPATPAVTNSRIPMMSRIFPAPSMQQ